MTCENLTGQFVELCRCGDHDAVKNWLRVHQSGDMVSFGFSQAFFLDHIAVLKQILRHDAFVLAGRLGPFMAPMSWMIEFGSIECIKLLFEDHRVPLSVFDDGRQSILLTSLLRDKKEKDSVFKYLLASGKAADAASRRAFLEILSSLQAQDDHMPSMATLKQYLRAPRTTAAQLRRELGWKKILVSPPLPPFFDTPTPTPSSPTGWSMPASRIFSLVLCVQGGLMWHDWNGGR